MTSTAHAESPTPTGPAEPTHGCVRCGAPIPISEGMCERCNPLGLKGPAASQAHGTVFAGIGIAVVGMAIVAHFLVTGIGPFRGTVAGVASAPSGLTVTISVTNEGSRAGSTTCRIDDPALPGIGPDAVFVQSPVVEPGATVRFQALVSSLGTQPKPLTTDCGA
jgi:predicted nucleic acid-binding Zn ribbon protein